jgi:ABC-type nitrate/sulfonate/bicarbonate transport system permease component
MASVEAPGHAPASPGSARPEGGVPWADYLLPLLGFGLLILLWESAPRLGWVRPTSFPPFSAVFAEAWEVLNDARFWSETGASGYRWAIGFAIAIVVGVPLGVAMGRSRPVYHAVDPLLTLTYPVPKAALILILVLFFGAGDVSRITIIVLGCFIPIVTSSYHGANGIEPRLLWGAYGLGTNRPKALLKVVIPAALPQIVSGLRLGISISIFALIASELLIRQSGIGAYLFTFYDLGATLRVWATASIIAVGGFLLDWAFVRLVRFTMPWLEGEL